MTAFSYATLAGGTTTVGSIQYWAQHSQIAVDQIIYEAQLWIFNKLRVREMIQRITFNIAQGTQSVALPSGFLDPLSMKLDGDDEDLDFVQENLLGRWYDDLGIIYQQRPTRYTIQPDDNDSTNTLKFQFDVPADAGPTGNGYNCRLSFYALPALISSGQQENILSLKYPTVFHDTLLAYAYKQRKRELYQAQLQLAQQGIDEVNAFADMQRRGQLVR